MSALIRTRRLLFTSGLVAVFLAMAGPAYAEKGFGGTDGETQEANAGKDGTVSVTVGGVVFDRSKNGSGNSAGALTSSKSARSYLYG